MLSRAEIARLLGQVEPTFAPMVALLYGSGLRLMECLRLRVKDVGFDRKILIVREGKGRKDRVVMLPEPLVIPLRRQLEHSRAFGRKTEPAEFPASPCRLHLPESIRATPRAGLGTGIPVADLVSRSALRHSSPTSPV